MSFSFNPSLGSVINIRPFHENHDSCHLKFYVYEDQDDSSNRTGTTRIPEIWTDAKLFEEDEGNNLVWKSIVFKKIQSSSLNPKKSNKILWQAELDLKSRSGTYGFTYRLSTESHSSEEDRNEERIEWLGSLGDNGQIRVHAPSIQKSVEDRLITDFKTNATDDVIIQHSPGITTHLFTYPFPKNITSSIEHQQTLIDLNDEAFDSIEGLLYERSKPTWYNPRSISSLNQVSQDFDTQAILFKRPIYDNLAVVLWPISHQNQSSTFRRNSNSQLVLCSSLSTHDESSNDPLQVAISTGPEWALQNLISAAVGNSEFDNTFSKNLRPQKLRFCTWNALGQDYRISNVFKALEDLEESKLANLFDSILLDDGWQDTSGRTLSGWGSKKDWFDEEKILSQSKHHHETHINNINSVNSDETDLKMAVDLIRRTGRGIIKYVGVWITLNGYWEGLDPHSDTMKEFKLQRWSVRNPENLSDHQTTTTWYLPSTSCILDFWNTYFGYLKSAGVDFVKVDNQAGLDYIYQCESQPTESAQSFRSKMWTSMNNSALRIFGVDSIDPLIHCMAHSPQIWGVRPSRLIESGKLSTSTAKWLMRTSDDFFPDELNPDAHRWHLISNAFNSLLACGIGFTPDFDMIMTRHPFSAYHTALRVFSSSPIYITDRIGEHDLVTTRKITSPLKSGGFGVVQSDGKSGTILAGRSLGTSMDQLTDDSTAWGLLKIGLPIKNIDGGLIGIWNVKNNCGIDVLTKRDISEALGIHQLQKDSLNQSKEIAIYSRNQRKFMVLENFNWIEEIKQPNHSSTSVMTVSLRENSFEILTVSKVWEVPCVSGIGIANFGVLDTFCGLTGISKVERIEIDQKKMKSKLESEVEIKPLIETKEEDKLPLEIKSIDQRIQSFLNLNTLQPYSRLRILYNYWIQDENKKETYLMILKGLLQDFLKSPIRTMFFEGFEVFKIILGVSFLFTSKVLFRFLPNLFKWNESLLIKNSSVLKKDEIKNSGDKGNEDERIELLKSTDLIDKQEQRESLDTIDNEHEGNENKLRFKTPFTNRIGFGLIINKSLIKFNQSEINEKKENEIFKYVRELIEFKVNEEIVESSLDFEKVEIDEKDEKLIYLVYLDLEKFTQTHFCEGLEKIDWLIEIEIVKKV